MIRGKGEKYYPNRNPHCQGNSIRKWEKRAAEHASMRHGPNDNLKQTAFRCFKAWNRKGCIRQIYKGQQENNQVSEHCNTAFL